MLFRKLFAATLILSIAFMSCESDEVPSDVIINFTATLNGMQEVPANNSTATGSSTASYNMTTKILTVTVTHTIATPTAGHIHMAAAGVSGPIVFPFTTAVSPISYTTTALTASQEVDLLGNMYYVNIHTAAFPGGEIRGQLLKSGTTADEVITFTATLDGIQEVPANLSTATGTAAGSYNKTQKILTVITNHTVAAPTNGHIHVGAEGVSGPVVFPFATFTTPITWSGSVTAAQETDLLNNLYYVNIHTAAYPGGEIRGQLYKAGTTPGNIINFGATLSGANSTPPNASTYTGTSTGTFNRTTKILSVTTTHTVPAPTNGHIHNGAVGVAGPVVYPFLSFTSPISFTSAAPLTAAQEVELLNGKNYVNIHTAAFPAGEIRGQLLRQ